MGINLDTNLKILWFYSEYPQDLFGYHAWFQSMKDQDMPSILESVKRWLIQITEMGLLLVALFVVLQILFGPDTGFLINNVVGNLPVSYTHLTLPTSDLE